MGQRKKNAVWFYLHMESKKQKPDTHRYWGHFDSCQMGGGLERLMKKEKGLRCENCKL